MSGGIDGPEGYAIVVAVSLLASMGITCAFSLAIVGAVRSAESRRSGRRAAAIGWSALSLVAVALVGLAIGLGLRILAG